VPAADRRFRAAYRATSFRRAAILSPATSSASLSGPKRLQKRVVFAEGEEEQVMRAAVSYSPARARHAILVGREDEIRAPPRRPGSIGGLTIANARLSSRQEAYAEFLYQRLQRKGYLYRDCQRMVNTDRNYFGAAMVAMGDADSA
jgi:malate dehydrogenase (oxaloacetate-decarboxylating)(NADP+)